MKTAFKANSSGVYIRLGVKKIKKRYNKKIHGSKVGLHRVMVGLNRNKYRKISMANLLMKKERIIKWVNILVLTVLEELQIKSYLQN